MTCVDCMRLEFITPTEILITCLNCGAERVASGTITVADAFAWHRDFCPRTPVADDSKTRCVFGRTKAGTAFSAQVSPDASPETWKAIEAIVDAARAKLDTGGDA